MTALASPRFGAWITLNSSIMAEQIARLGYDFIVVDGQHGLLGYAEMRDALIAVTAGGCPLPIARVSTNDPGEIGRMLDAGARGIIVPMVESAREAERAAAACRYATSGGRRSYSPVRHGAHFGAAPGETDTGVLLLAMIETKAALADLDGILDVPGLDGVFVGPYDLSLALGAKIPFEERVQPELEAAVTRIRTSALDRGKVAGIYCGTGDAAIQRAREGFTLINTCHDMSAVRESMGAELAAVVASGLITAEHLEEELRAH